MMAFDILLFFGLSRIVTEVMGMISGALLPLPAFCLNSVQVLTCSFFST